MVKCAVGVIDRFIVRVRLYKGSAQTPFLFAMVIYSLTDEIGQESL